MTQASVTMILDTERVRGHINTSLWPLDGSRAEVLVQLDNGRQKMIPFTALHRQEDGSYIVNVPKDELERQPLGNKVDSNVDPDHSVVIPVMAEEVTVDKRVRESGRVRITKTVHEREELIDEPFFREEVIVERVAINRFVEEPIPIRYEGDTIIVSLLEEVPIIEKRLMLKEELRITRRPVEGHNPLSVIVRSEEATVERIGPQNRENSEEEA